MARQAGSGPLAVLDEDANHTTGDEARAMVLSAAQSVGTAIRTTLGPRGMDKMLLDDESNVLVTNDGATLIEGMDIKHPGAKLIAEVAGTQEEEVGDGTTTAVVVASQLLAEAEDLMDDLQPATIVGGYRRAAAIAREELDAIEASVEPDDTDLLEAIAATAMTGKGAETERDLLAELVVRAVRTAAREAQGGRDATDAKRDTAETGSGGIEVDRDAIDVRRFAGGAVGDSRFIPGAIIDKEPPHPGMPASVPDANVLVYEGAIEVSEVEADTGATVSDRAGADAFVEAERAELDEAVDAIREAGADVVLADGGIDDHAQGRLADAGVLALRRVDEGDRERVAAATDATRVGSLDSLSSADLGFADGVDQERIRQTVRVGAAPPEETVVFEGGAGSETATLLLRGGTSHVLDEIERAVIDGVGVVSAAVEDGAVLPGGGAPEIALAGAVREAASGVEGREQLAAEAFADALDVVPRTLAENAGHDVLDALVALRARHDAGDRATGFDAEAGEPVDALAAGVVEPRRVTETTIESAVEAAAMILRIDAIVTATGDEAGME